MKKNEVQAGVIYGYAQGTSEYRHANPVIVLDAKGLWTWHRPTRDSAQKYKVSNEKRYTAAIGGWSSYSGPSGYLVLTGRNHQDPEVQDAHLAELKALYTEFSATAGNPDAVNELAEKLRGHNHIRMEIVNNRWISGDYVEAKNEEAEREAARTAKYKAERDRSAAEAALLSEVAEAMGVKLEKEVSIHSDRAWGYTRGSIKLEDLAAFFGLKTVQERL